MPRSEGDGRELIPRGSRWTTLSLLTVPNDLIFNSEAELTDFIAGQAETTSGLKQLSVGAELQVVKEQLPGLYLVKIIQDRNYTGKVAIIPAEIFRTELAQM